MRPVDEMFKTIDGCRWRRQVLRDFGAVDERPQRRRIGGLQFAKRDFSGAKDRKTLAPVRACGVSGADNHRARFGAAACHAKEPFHTERWVSKWPASPTGFHNILCVRQLARARFASRDYTDVS